jgi:hypothetical protein
MSDDVPRIPDPAPLSNDSQSYNDQSEGSDPRGDVDDPRDGTDPDDAVPHPGRAEPLFSGRRRTSLGEPRPGTSSSEGLDGLPPEDEEEDAKRNLGPETSDSEVERPGFRFNLITRKREFIQTTGEPETAAKTRETTATIINLFRQKRDPPRSKSCILL